MRLTYSRIYSYENKYNPIGGNASNNLKKSYNIKTFWYYSHNILIRLLRSNRSSRPRKCSVKKVFLEICQNLQENKCARVSFFDKVAGLSHFFVVAQRHHKEVWKACNFIKKETFAQELSYEFWTPLLYNTSGGCFLSKKDHWNICYFWNQSIEMNKQKLVNFWAW